MKKTVIPRIIPYIVIAILAVLLIWSLFFQKGDVINDTGATYGKAMREQCAAVYKQTDFCLANALRLLEASKTDPSQLESALYYLRLVRETGMCTVDFYLDGKVFVQGADYNTFMMRPEQNISFLENYMKDHDSYLDHHIKYLDDLIGAINEFRAKTDSEDKALSEGVYYNAMHELAERSDALFAVGASEDGNSGMDK